MMNQPNLLFAKAGKKYYLLFCIILLGTHCIQAQDHSDAKRLANLSYMELAANIDCNNTIGSNLENRICLNLEFQEVDSLMNITFEQYLSRVEHDSIKIEIVQYQDEWIKHRRLQSEVRSDGARGHMLGIMYLHTMVFVTRKRLEELEYLLER